MTVLEWDQIGERLYETGVDHGVLFVADGSGGYEDGVAWNGLTTVTETPSGADWSPLYADNIKYLNLVSVEQFGGTVEAFTYPDEFCQCDGLVHPSPGVGLSQQARKSFGLAYRTRLGNDVDGDDHGYKLHLLYGASAKPSQKAYATVNDSPAAIAFSWEIATIPLAVAGYKPMSLITIDSTLVDAGALSDLCDIIWGTVSSESRLPMPDEVIDLFGGAVTIVDVGVTANKPTYNAGTHVVTLPAVTGVQWKINGVNKAPGAQPAMTVGQISEVKATPQDGYSLIGDTDFEFEY